MKITKVTALTGLSFPAFQAAVSRFRLDAQAAAVVAQFVCQLDNGDTSNSIPTITNVFVGNSTRVLSLVSRQFSASKFWLKLLTRSLEIAKLGSLRIRAIDLRGRIST